MSLTRGQNYQNVEESALPVIGKPARTDDESLFKAIDSHLDQPFRLYATQPTADAVLNIGAAEAAMGDGAGRSIGPQDDIVVSNALTQINMQTGLLAGGSVKCNGTTYTNGQTVVFSTSAGVGKYRRMIVCSQSDGTLTISFGSEYTSLALLNADTTQNAGALAASVGGILVGWVDLQSTSTGPAYYKTADSTSSIIENSNGSGTRIHRVVLGSGGGGSGDKSFKLSAIASNVATIKGGYLLLEDGRELVTYDGTTDSADLSINLKTETNSAGVTAPSATTAYYLYLDLEVLSNTATTMSNGRSVYRVQKGTSGAFVVLASTPTSVDLARYVPIAVLKTDGSSNYTYTINEDLARRTTANLASSVEAAFRLISVVNNVATLRGGFMTTEAGTELASYDGAGHYGVDMTVDLKTQVSGVTAPSASSTYWLYLDSFNVYQHSVVTLPSGRRVFRVDHSTTGYFYISSSSPDSGLISTSRFIPLAVLKTDGSSNYVYSTQSSVSFRRGQVLSNLAETGFAVTGVTDTGANNQASLRGGYLLTDQGYELALTPDGTTFGVDVQIFLQNNFSASGVSAPTANQTGYYLYLDLVSILAQGSLTLDNGRKVYPVYTSGTPHGFAIFQSPPSAVDLDRYIPIACFDADASGNYVYRTHSNVSPRSYASADKAFKVVSFSSMGCTLKGGYLALDDGRALATYTGSGSTSTSFGSDLAVSLNSILTASSLSALGTLNTAGAKLLALAIDLTTLSSVTTLTDNNRQVYGIQEANLKLLDQADLTKIDPRRYVLLDQVLIAQTVTVWTDASSIAKPARIHDTLAAFFPYLETKVFTFTATGGVQVLSHNLSGEPQVLSAVYYDGTVRKPQDVSSYVSYKNTTSVAINPDAAPAYGSGQYLEVTCVYVPGMTALASLSRSFTSGWMTSTATTTLPHALNDREDIRGYEVQEYNTSTGKIRNIDRSALVKNFDDTNFYLDWTGLSPSATLQYRVVAGGSPLPWAIPSRLTGYTLYVGQGPGSYATVTAALAAAQAGDRILVMRDTAETADLSVPAGVTVEQMPNTTVALTGALTNGVRFTGAKAKWTHMNVRLNPTGTQAKGVSIESSDCWVTGWLELATAQTLTDALNVAVGATRPYVQLGVKATLGTVTNLETNLDGAGKTDVWGG